MWDGDRESGREKDGSAVLRTVLVDDRWIPIGMHHGLVSVLIPVYNAGPLLRASVSSVLTQTYQNLEVIIIDDGSTDHCLDSIVDLKDGRIRLLRQKNAGKPAALNAALSILKGDFYAVQDADDISYPTRIEKQVKCLRQNPALAAVFVGHDLRIADRTMAPRFAAKDEATCRQDIEKMRMPAHDPTVMYRVSSVRDFRYDESLPVVEGFDYILRVGELFPMLVWGECLYSYRIHPKSLTSQSLQRNQMMVRKVLEKTSTRRSIPIQPELLGSASRRKQRDELGIVTQSMESVLDFRRSGQTAAALKVALGCLCLRPYDVFYSRPLVFWAAPLRVIHWYRHRKSNAGNGQIHNQVN
jgi:glycosyltransferase involved in cell wall biosynthesis